MKVYVKTIRRNNCKPLQTLSATKSFLSLVNVATLILRIHTHMSIKVRNIAYTAEEISSSYSPCFSLSTPCMFITVATRLIV